MTVAKRPGRRRNETNSADGADAKAEQFISGAGEPAQPSKATKKMTTLRMDPATLERIDRAAAHHGISRAAWINYQIARVLDDEGW